MSMEIYVFSDRQLHSLADWQRSIDAENIPIVLPSDVAFDELDGFLPVHASGKPTGFECDHWNARDLIAFYRRIQFGKNWTFCLAFRWGGDFDEGLAAYL